MIPFLWILAALHLYLLQWGRRAYWRQVHVTLAQKTSV